jgi:gliding motility-associated-like protein
MKIMDTKLFFRLLLGFVVLIMNHNLQAQTSDAQIDVIIDGSKCSSNGKAKITVVVTPTKEGDIIDDSKAVYSIYKDQKFHTEKRANEIIELAPGNDYVIYATNLFCNGKLVSGTPPSISFPVTLGLIITKAEYKRCSKSDIFVSGAILGGSENGPYRYKLIDGNNVIKDTTLSASNKFSFSAKTSSSNLKIEMIDNGCSKDSPVRIDLETNSILESSLIEGDTTACKYGNMKLSVKSAYSGNKCTWKKGDKLISDKSTMEILNATEEHEGEYRFSMTFEGCDKEYSETFTIKLSGPQKPNVPIEPQYICFNSGTISLDNSKYASPTSDTYTLAWYRADGTFISETAPKLNSNDPNLIGTTEYLVSQKNSTGCESLKAKLTIIVENLPAKIGDNNIIFCTSSDSKPTMRIIKAGNYTYNLYTENVGGKPIGSGTSVNDTAFIKTTQDLVVGKTYFLETQNIHGCVSSERTIVVVSIKDSWIHGPEKVCFGDNLSLSSGYAGGKIMWTKPNGSTDNSDVLSIDSVKFTDAGIYRLLIQEPGLGCTMRDEIRVAVTQPVPPTVTKDSFRYVPTDTPSAMTASTTATNFTLKWYDPNGNPISGQSPKPVIDKEGVFVYHVSQDSSGCESPKVPITVIVGNVPSAVPATDIGICISDKPVVRIKNTIKDYTYTVYYKTNVIVEGKGNGDEILLSSNVVITEDSEIEITVTDIYGIKSSATKKSVITPASLIKESPSTVCFGSSFQLVAIDLNETNYVWTLPNGSKHEGKSVPVTYADYKNAGKYILTITTLGCPVVANAEESVRITQPEPPKVDKDSYVFSENESAMPLTATPKAGCTLKWYNPSGDLLSGQSPVPPTNNAGVFVYKVSQDSLGCESQKVEVTVMVGEIPSSVPVADINICIADKPVIHIDKTIKNYKYTVYYKNEVIAEKKGNGGNISLTSNVSISENTELAIIVSDTLNISSERTKVNLISVNNLIDLQNSTSSVCDGSTGKLVAVDITGASYVWTTLRGTETTQSITIPNASKADAGKYTLAVTTQGCAVAEQTTELKVEKPTKPSVTREVYYCTGDEAFKLTATALSGYKLVWFNESQTQLSDAPIPNTSSAGTSIYYVLQMSTSDKNCLSDQETITVVVENKPEAVVLDPVNVCIIPGNTQPVSVRIPDSSEGYIYSLYSQETGGSLVGYAASDGNGSPVDITIKDSEVISGMTYYLEITNKAGCTSDRTPVEVVITEMALLPDELPPYQINELYSQRLTTTVSEPRYEIVQGYLPIGFTLSSMGDISGTATEYADPFVFTVEVTSSLGCSVKKEYTLRSELLVSKMFSPNGDGINDMFMKGYKVIIFDCIGRKLFSGDDGWDGTYNGKVMPEDVYYYILYYKDKDGKERRITSYVTLIKTI